uniref:Uncharacterized protein n=1 Tax=Rhipicephalus zambeziensis TaxID=60191 RepID=A0A224Y6U1_9ACAR
MNWQCDLNCAYPFKAHIYHSYKHFSKEARAITYCLQVQEMLVISRENLMNISTKLGLACACDFQSPLNTARYIKLINIHQQGAIFCNDLVSEELGLPAKMAKLGCHQSCAGKVGFPETKLLLKTNSGFLPNLFNSAKGNDAMQDEEKRMLFPVPLVFFSLRCVIIFCTV